MARRSPKTRPLAPYETHPALYRHVAHPHQPRHPSERYDEERQAHVTRHAQPWRQRLSSINEQIAIVLTQAFGSMPAVYLFAGIGIGSLVGVFTGNAILAAICGATSSYFLQLVALPTLQKGNIILNRKQEIQGDEAFHATMRTLHENGEILKHLNAQDGELLRQTAELQRQTDMILRIAAKLALENVTATTPVVNLAAPDTHTVDRHRDAAATSPANPPAPAPVAASRAQSAAPQPVKAPHAASPATTSASAHSRRGAPASGQRRRGYQTSSR